jgi:hypothetical protein
MKKQYGTFKMILLPLVFTGCCVISVHAETILVPKDVGTIQAGIDKAQGDDTVLVSPGRYNESINFKGKAITLKSEKGPALTIIDGYRIGDSVMKCINGEGPSTKIDGFTITGGTGNTELYGEFETVGGGLICLHSSPTVVHCIFVENEAIRSSVIAKFDQIKQPEVLASITPKARQKFATLNFIKIMQVMVAVGCTTMDQALELFRVTFEITNHNITVERSTITTVLVE